MSQNSFLSLFREAKPDWTLIAIRLYTLTVNFLHVVTTQSVKSVKYLTNSFKEDIYMFIHHTNLVPVPYSSYDLTKVGSASPNAFYNRDTKTLSLHPNTTNTHNHTLDIYSAQLFHGEFMLYDLTDFFESTFFAEQDFIPCLKYWLGAWCLENKVFLNPKSQFTLRFKTLEGDAYSFDIWSESDDDLARWQRMNQSVPRIQRPVELVRSSQPISAGSSDSPVVASPDNTPASVAGAGSTLAPVPASDADAPAPFEEHKTDPFYEELMATDQTPEPLHGGSTTVREVQPANA